MLFIRTRKHSLERHLWYHCFRDRLTRILPTSRCTHPTMDSFVMPGKKTYETCWSRFSHYWWFAQASQEQLVVW